MISFEPMSSMYVNLLVLQFTTSNDSSLASLQSTIQSLYFLMVLDSCSILNTIMVAL